MIFQILLFAALCVLAVYAYFQRRRSAAIAYAVSVMAAVGMVLVAKPDLANQAANLVGIGRGADLTLYCFILISLVAIFNLHLRFRSADRNLTRLVRTLAQITARGPELSPTPKDGRQGL